MSENRRPTLLVTGASGQLGRRVIELLLEAQAGTLIAATRSPEKLADFSEQGVIVRAANFDDPASLAEAFKGVDRLLLISTDTLGVPGQRLQQHLNAVKAAEEAGVKHVVYTSMNNPGPESPIAIAPDHYGTEQALEASKIEGWTVLRNNLYMDLQTAMLGRAVQEGKLVAAAGTGKTGYVTREDCAQAAAAALASNFSGKRILDITGSEALSYADLAQLATTISGQPVIYVSLELETLVQAMVAQGFPRPVAELYASFDAGVAQGALDVVTNAIEELTGRKPTRMADYLASQRDELIGEPLAE